jgi:hypothetical protein
MASVGLNEDAACRGGLTPKIRWRNRIQDESNIAQGEPYDGREKHLGTL